MLLASVSFIHYSALFDLLMLLPDVVAEAEYFLFSLALFVQIDVMQLVHVFVHDFEHLQFVEGTLGDPWLTHDLTHFIIESEFFDVNV